MKEIELNGTIYRWELVGGGKGLIIENKYIKRPYCQITYEGESLIKEPEEMVLDVLRVLFASEPLQVGRYDNPPEDEEEPLVLKLVYKCKVCGKLCKSKAGLRAHSRSHKLKTKKGGK